MRTLTFAALLIASSAFSSRAEEPEDRTFSIRGFGTAGIVHSDEGQADYRASQFKPNGAGYTHRWSADVDSLLGVQLSADITPRLSAVVQLISEQNYDRTYRPHAEWANLKYQFDPDFSVRVGRTALPLFLVTDSRKIGFVNPWVRPPAGIYDVISLTSNDGVDANYRLQTGSVTQTLQVTAGRSTSRFPVSGTLTTVKSHGVRALVDTLELGPSTVRLSYARAQVTIPELAPLFDAFRQYGTQGAAIADRYQVDATLSTLLGIGATYDPGDWFVTGEVVRFNAHSVVGSNLGWYVSGGYRIARVTPYFIYSRAHGDSNTSDPGLSVANLPPALAPVAMALNSALDATLANKIEQSTVSIGARWDVAKEAALKLQFDHTQLGPNSAGTLTNLQPGFARGGSYNVISVTFDFVF